LAEITENRGLRSDLKSRKAEHINPWYVSRVLRMTLLAPEIGDR
jgi:hypothetical protein